jgi:hypothetical protein
MKHPVLSNLITLAALALFSAGETYATEQAPDEFVYDGKTYASPEYFLSEFFDREKDKNKYKWIWENSFNSAMWSGYIATYEIVNNELILKDISDNFFEGKSIMEKFLSTAGVEKDSVFKIDWFTGQIILSVGKIVHSGVFYARQPPRRRDPAKVIILAPIHGLREYQLLLDFENGVLVKEYRMGYMEYFKTYLKDGLSPSQYQRVLEYLEHYAATEKGSGSEFLSGLKTQYKKKFGAPISDFELAVTGVSVYGITPQGSITVTRTLKGARAQYSYNDLTETELSMGEWLDFIRALYKCGIDKLESKSGKYKSGGMNWGISIYTSDKEKPDKFSQYNSTLPNYDELKKVMAAMETRIRRNPEVRALEAQLEAEHKRIYGVPITGLERSVKHVSFILWGDGVKNRIKITVTRTATGAAVRWDDRLNVQLDTEEWLSFAKAVFGCGIDKWEREYSGNLSDTTRFSWRMRASFTDRNDLESEGTRVYPPNWDKFKKIVVAVVVKIKDGGKLQIQ